MNNNPLSVSEGFPSQVQLALRPVSLPSKLLGPSLEEAVSPVKKISKSVLANGEKVGVLQQVGRTVSRRLTP